MIAHPHRFAPSHQTTPTQCDFCEQKLWGPVKVSDGLLQSDFTLIHVSVNKTYLSTSDRSTV